jgi:hypothetical protein
MHDPLQRTILYQGAVVAPAPGALPQEYLRSATIRAQFFFSHPSLHSIIPNRQAPMKNGKL